MPKRPAEPPNMEDIQPPREFKSDPTLDPPSQPIDPDGEEAYQRAAIKAAQMKPPRVPNPLAFPNSPTAQAFMKSRTQEVPERRPTRIANPLFVAAPLDVHARERKRLQDLRNAEQQSGATTPGSSSAPAPPSAPSPPPPSSLSNRELPSLSQYVDRNQGQPPPTYQYQQQQPQQLGQQPHPTDQPLRMPHTMEPQMQAPKGPRNPFR